MTSTSRGTILIIEDSRAIGNYMVQLLKREGFSVTWAPDGAAGLAAYRERAHDCIVLDIVMPTVDGWDVLRTIREEDDATQILVLTGLGSAEQRAAGLQRGADDYVAKPFDHHEFIARVEKRVSAARRLRELHAARQSALHEMARRSDRPIPQDLSQPLSQIIGYGQLLQDPKRSYNDVQEMAEIIVQAGFKLAELVRAFGDPRDGRSRHTSAPELPAAPPQSSPTSPTDERPT